MSSLWLTLPGLFSAGLGSGPPSPLMQWGEHVCLWVGDPVPHSPGDHFGFMGNFSLGTKLNPSGPRSAALFAPGLPMPSQVGFSPGCC